MRMDAIRLVLLRRDIQDREYKYIHTDALGTPLRVTDKSATVVWQATYDPYGRAMPSVDPDGNGLSTVMNLRFPGQYFDSETGFHYNWHRTYDPDTGRYLEPDPIGLMGGLNRHAYVGGNPISFVDPLGLEGVGPWTYPAGPMRDSYNAAWNGNVTLNFQAGLGGSLGYYMAGVAGDAGIAFDTNGTMCFYAKGCGATPVAGGFIGGASLQGGGSCGIGELNSGTEMSGQLQLGGIAGGGLKGSVEASGSGVSVGLNGGVGWQVSGGLQLCQTQYWCTR